MNKLPSKLSCGPDGLPPIFYKKLSLVLAEPLAYIYQFSFVTGKIPIDWKTANVTPVFKKKGSSSCVQNYRPISVTCVPSIVMEGILSEGVTYSLLQEHIISPDQHGFLTRKSTVTQMLSCLNDWTKSLDNGQVTDVIYLDIAKAFDTVSHPKLLDKLKLFNFSQQFLNWVESYLSDRRQRVLLNGTISEWEPMTSGVPQGSKLGPLLFLLYINDITNAISICELKLFADDCKLYFSCAPPFDFSPLQNDLENIYKWAKNSQLQIAFGKSAVLHIGQSNPKTVYALDNVPIPSVSFIKDLGFTITSDLKFHSHCNEICKSAYSISALIFKCFEIKTKTFLQKMFQTYVRPRLEYGTQVWNSHFNMDIDKIERIQRSFTKRIPNLVNLTYPQRLENLELLTLETRRLIADLTMVYKILHQMVDLDPASFFVPSPVESTRGHPFKLFQCQSRLDIRKYFFCNRVVSQWNSLPSHIVKATSLASFRTRLIDFLILRGGD